MVTFKITKQPDQKLQELIVSFWNNKIWHSNN